MASTAKKRVQYPHSHYQTKKTLTIEVAVHGVTATEVQSRFTTDHVSVDINRETPAETYSFQLTPFAEIKPSKCQCIIKPDKVVLKIRKVDPADWEIIFRKTEKPPAAETDSAQDAQGKNAEGQTKKPLPGPYATQKDWDEIDRNLTQELEAEKPKDEAALNKLFQDIYAKADPDTRRAMVKSMQTSGGTVLSTNWNEVKGKDYEGKDRVTAEGMEWKKYGE